MRNKIDLLKKYEALERPLILDGAMGTLLQQRNIPIHQNLWSSAANITHPHEVLRIHQEYIKSGAEIITTNTFRTNPNVFQHSNLNITNDEFVRCSVQLAIDAVEDKGIIIAGSNAPAEDCYQKERQISMNKLEINHKLHIESLWESGVDLIWNETQSHLDEIEIICKFCCDNSFPYTVNIYFDDDLKLLSGEPLNVAVDFISDFSPLVIGFNCVKPHLLKEYFGKYSPAKNWGFYFNCGKSDVHAGNISCDLDSSGYIEEIKPFLEMNPVYAGSCCGSNLDHTKEIKRLFDELYRN